MKRDWDGLYKEKGIVQKQPSKFAVDAINFFKENRLEKILDLGCGTGRHTAYLLKEGFEVFGCDSSENALKIAKEMLPQIEFKGCEMTSLPYEDSCFDGVLCHFVIHHAVVKDIKKAISEIYRILRNRGIAYVSVISTKHEEYSTGQEIEKNTRINIDAIDGENPHHFFTEEEANNFFKRFEIIKTEHLEYPSEKDSSKKAAAYLIYARK